MAALAWAGVPWMVHPPPPGGRRRRGWRTRPGVEGLAVGAQGDLTLRGLQLADGDGIVHLQLADEGGDVLQILLGGLEVPDQVQGDVGKTRVPFCAKSISLHQAALNLHPLKGLDPEVPLVHPLGIKAGVHQGGGDAVGGRGGVE